MYLLDTNVVSELRKIGAGKSDPNVAAWFTAINPAELFISVITVQELDIGIRLKLRKDVKQGAMLRTWLDDYVLPAFKDRILSIDTAVARRSAAMHVPNPRPVRDTFIAATALEHRMIVVTRNTVDFEETGVNMINPWAPNHPSQSI